MARQERRRIGECVTPPATWPDALTRRWQIEVGEGHATPLVIDDAVYVFARRNEDEVMIAVDGATGRERWRSAYPAPYTPSVARWSRVVDVPVGRSRDGGNDADRVSRHGHRERLATGSRAVQAG